MTFPPDSHDPPSWRTRLQALQSGLSASATDPQAALTALAHLRAGLHAPRLLLPPADLPPGTVAIRLVDVDGDGRRALLAETADGALVVLTPTAAGWRQPDAGALPAQSGADPGLVMTPGTPGAWRAILAGKAGPAAAGEGLVTAAAIWPADETTDAILLAATDDRLLLLITAEGNVTTRLALPATLRVLLPCPEQGQLLALTDAGRLLLIDPLLPGAAALLPDPQPWLARLTPDERAALADRWLDSADPALIDGALTLLLDAGDPACVTHLQGVVERRPAAAPVLLAVLERLALAATEADDPHVRLALVLADRWCGLRSPALQRRINRLTARIAARWRTEVATDGHWRSLNAVRRQGDRALAESYAAAGRDAGDADLLRAGLNFYARMLLLRREELWIFATNRALRALVALPDSSCALVATAAGRLYELDMWAPQVSDQRLLAAGAVARTMVSGSGGAGARGQIVALVTTEGAVLLAARAAEHPLAALAQAATVAPDSRCLLLLPADDRRPAALLVGGMAGQILVFEQTPAGDWLPSPALQVAAARVNCLTLAVPAPGAAPLLLVGSTLEDGRGELVRLALDGTPRGASLLLPGGVRDAQLVPSAGAARYLLAILCDDGFLYVVGDNGARQWAYRVGRSARNVTVLDIDRDAQPEIVVGGPDDTVLVLDAGGAIRWHIPVQAPVTHVAAARSAEGHPLLLISDLENVLQMVQVNPPGGDQEQACQRAADAWLAELATLEGCTTVDLTMRWAAAAPTDFLRGFAFAACALQPGLGHETLLATDVTTAPAVVQRAYARALVRAAGTDAPQPAMVARLRRLIGDPATRDQIGLAALRRLAQLRDLPGVALVRWAPVLEAAAAHHLADVQRSVLFAVKGMQPLVDSGTDLQPQVWQILRTILASPSDGDDWVRGDLAGMVRDLATTPAQLWGLAHALLAQMPEPGCSRCSAGQICVCSMSSRCRRRWGRWIGSAWPQPRKRPAAKCRRSRPPWPRRFRTAGAA